MKLGIGLIVWGVATALYWAFRLGIWYVAFFGTGDFLLDACFFTGIWLVVGGVPLFLGIRRIKKQVKRNETVH